MEIKKYYTQDMGEAMERIRRELGPDAVILSDRKVRKKGLKGFFSPRVLEVVVAYEKGEDKLRKLVEDRAPDVNQRMDNLRAVLEAVDKRAAQTAAQNSGGSIYRQGAAPPPEKPARTATLTEKQVESKLTPLQQQRKLEEEIAQRVLGGGAAQSASAAEQGWEPYAPRPLQVDMEAAERAAQDDNAYRRPVQLELPNLPEPINPPTEPEWVPEDAAEEETAEQPAANSSELAAMLRRELEEMRKAQSEEIKSLEERLTQDRETMDEESLAAMQTRLSGLQNVVETLADRVGSLPTVRPRAYEGETQVFFDRLIANDVHEDVAHVMVQEAEDIIEKMGGNMREVLELLLAEKMGNVSVPLQPQKSKPCVVILFGPTGVGKTTTLVKLAAFYAVQEGKKVAMINADTYRIAAHEQLRTYADIISTPTRIVYSPTEIVDALREFSDMDMIFIDTAGKKPSDAVHKEEIARLVELTGATEQLLVLSAPSSYQTLRQIIDNYSFLKDYKLIITKTDEVTGMGAVLGGAVYSGRPLSYITCGQNVPDDIERANVAKIAHALLEE